MKHRYPRRSFLQDFIKGFAITCAVIIPSFVAGFMLLRGSLMSSNELEAIPQQAAPQQKVPLATLKSYNLLVLAEGDSELLTATLLRLDSTSEQVLISDIPLETVLLNNKNTSALSSIYKTRGSIGVADAIKETLEIEIDHYIALPKDTALKALELAGKFNFALDREVTVSDSASGTSYSLSPGVHLLSADEVLYIIEHGGYYQTNKTTLKESIWESVLLEYGMSGNYRSFISLYSEIVNNCNTDIDSASVYSISKTLSAICENNIEIATVTLEGIYVENRFELDEDAGFLLHKYF